MIENLEFVSNLEEIVKIDSIDAFFIGPYDLSASLGVPGNFNSQVYKNTLSKIIKICNKNNKPIGIHVVEPNVKDLKKSILSGYQFIAYSLDTVFLNHSSRFPNLK